MRQLYRTPCDVQTQPSLERCLGQIPSLLARSKRLRNEAEVLLKFMLGVGAVVVVCLALGFQHHTAHLGQPPGPLRARVALCVCVCVCVCVRVCVCVCACVCIIRQA